jgi:hypothetical protein
MQLFRKTILLVILAGFAFLIVHLLYKKTSDTEILQKNGFTRSFSGSLTGLHTIKLSDKTYKLVSVEGSTLTVLNESLENVVKVSLSGNFLTNIPIGSFKTCRPYKFHDVSVNNNIITVFDSRTKSISTKDLSNKNDTGSCISIKNPLIRGVQISNTFILWTLDSVNKYPEFLKIDPTVLKITRETNISEKKPGGALEDDGIFIPVDNSKAIFLYYHKNIYKCIDTSLKLMFTRHTIDTSTTAPKIKALPMGGYAFSVPVRVKNIRGCADNNILYVNSSLIAENEVKNSFRNNSVIDRYELQTGSYLGSFYIPMLKGEKINDFKIYRDTIYALYERDVKIFRLTYPRK